MTTESNRRGWLRLARSKGIGPSQFIKLRERFESADYATDFVQGKNNARIALKPLQDIDAELEKLDKSGATLLLYGDAAYPYFLKQIPTAPPALTLMGDPAFLARTCVAMVGARNASRNGCQFAHDLSLDLAKAGITVVSGLARGVDTAAHEGAVSELGGTIGIIATGIDVTYPRENAHLHALIAEKGCLVTERPFGAAPSSRFFPSRNRIIAGLSRSTVVVEAAARSGSLITARNAADFGRDVMAVPGSPLDARHEGTNLLLREGACLIRNAQDVLEELGEVGCLSSDALTSAELIDFKPRSSPAAVLSDPQDTPCAKEMQRPEMGEFQPVLMLEGGLRSDILNRLDYAPVSVDELIRQCQANPSEVQAALIELEIDGRIERQSGNRIVRLGL